MRPGASKKATVAPDKFAGSCSGLTKGQLMAWVFTAENL
jgi:hypothetical protein